MRSLPINHHAATEPELHSFREAPPVWIKCILELAAPERYRRGFLGACAALNEHRGSGADVDFEKVASSQPVRKEEVIVHSEIWLVAMATWD